MIDASPPPIVAYAGFFGTAPLPRVRVATATGAVLLRVRGTDGSVALNAGVVATSQVLGGGRGDVVLRRARDGKVLVRIHDAAFPLISASGRFVAFTPDRFGGPTADRDARINSVWIHDRRSHTTRRLVRFTNDDRIPLAMAFSPGGAYLAIAHGNDADLLEYDLWIRSTKSGAAPVRQLTTDGHSTEPWFSTDGRTIFFTRYQAQGDTSGEIWAIGRDGTGLRQVAAPPAGESYSRPKVVDATTAIIWRIVGGAFTVARLDLATGTVTDLGLPPTFDFDVSRSRRLLLVRGVDDVLRLRDLVSGTTTVLPGGRILRGGLVDLVD